MSETSKKKRWVCLSCLHKAGSKGLRYSSHGVMPCELCNRVGPCAPLGAQKFHDLTAIIGSGERSER
jgi:hypothetical protein